MNRVAELEARIGACGSAVVAFSGGVDSSLVAALAARALGERALAVTAVSPALATGELDGASAVAAKVGIAHETVRTAELDRAGYRANGPDRCYHCKTELYDRLLTLAEERGFRAVLSGANADDLGDWRPGLRAAAERGVLHPLVEAGIGKEGVRSLARTLGVPSAEKPASPCLASRIPHGSPVTPEALARIDRAERELRGRGYRVLRVRHLGDQARVELGEEEIRRAASPERRREIVAAVESAGYREIEIAEAPFRSGSLTAQFVGRLRGPRGAA
ncbi:MAG: ATP-dependent sacrificial sulfur transferase LarE [Gaiellales bacterium]